MKQHTQRCAVLLTGTFLSFVCASAQTTRSVAKSGADSGTCAGSACLTIGYAVGQSASGDTINVGAGTYTESVNIAISLTISGASGGGGTIVTGPTGAVGAVQAGAFVVNTPGVTVILSNLAIQNSLAQGGIGGTGGGAGGGGGGAGMGGALFVGTGANVTVSNVVLQNNGANGGNGGNASGAAALLCQGGNSSVGTGGGACSTSGTGGFGGGGGALPSVAGNGGQGGFGGGGGGASSQGRATAFTGGLAGFGAGAGGDAPGGGTGGGGGGGAGLGGAIFVEQGGSLTVAGTSTSTGNTALNGGAGAGYNGGNGGNPGTLAYSGIFLQGTDTLDAGSGSITFNTPLSGDVVNPADGISDQNGLAGSGGQWSVTKTGAGMLVLNAANTYTGQTSILAGSVQVVGSIGTSTVTAGLVSATSGATLGGGGTIYADVNLNGTLQPGLAAGIAETLHINGALTVQPTATANFVLFSSSSDQIAVTGTLTNFGFAPPWQFNFQNSGTAGQTYTLATFGSTTLSAGNLSYIGLGPGLTGNFIVNATSLQFAVTSVPTSTSISFGASSITYGQSETITATVTSGAGTPTGTVAFVDTTTSTLLANVAVNGGGQASFALSTTLTAGAHTFQASYTPTPNTWVSSSNTGTVNVAKAGLTISANTRVKTYGQTVTFAGTEFTATTLYNGDTVSSVTLTSSGAAATAAATVYTIVPSAATGTGLSNYTIVYSTSSLTVNQAALTVTATSTSKTYGAAFSGTAFTTTGTLYNGDTVTSVTLTSSGAAPTATVAGSPYSLVPSAAVGTGVANYSITYANGSLTVDQAALTVTATSTSKTYGSTFAGTAFTTTGTLYNGDAISSVTLASSGAAATATVAGSPYSLVPSAALGTGLANYSITYANGSLTVSAAGLNITANTRSKTYGQAVVFAGTEFTTGTLYNGDTVTSVTLTSAGAAAAASIAGSPYSIVPSAAVGTGLGNYTIGYTNGSLTVNPVTLTVSAGNASMAFGSALPTFTASITGFVNGDTSAVVSGAPSLTTAATSASPAGTYPIVAAIGTLAATNYTFAFVSGTLTIIGSQPALISVVSGNGQTGVQGIALAAPLVAIVTNGSGGPAAGTEVSFTVTSGSATLSSPIVYTGAGGQVQTSVTPTGAGTIVISATINPLIPAAVFTETGLATFAAPQLSVLPAALTLTAVQGGGNPTPMNVVVSNTGTGVLQWSAAISGTTGSASWLALSSASGATPAVTVASFNTAGLTPGSYQGTITVTSGAMHQTVAVSLTVTAPAPAEFTLTPEAIVVNTATGSTTPITRTIGVANGGAGTLTWNATAGTGNPWLSVSPASGSAPSQLTVQLNPSGLAAGQYLANIAFSSTETPPANVPVVLNVSALPSLITSVPELDFRSPVGSGAFASAIPINSSTGAVISYSATVTVTSGQTWLTVGSATGVTGSHLSIQASTSGLAPGFYTGYVSVSSAAAANTLVIPVVLDLSAASAPGSLSASPGGILFSGASGGTAPSGQLIILSSDGGTFSWNATALDYTGGAWLTVSPASGTSTVNGSLTVSANTVGLAPGSYSGQVAISSTGTSNTLLIVPVTLIVSSGTTPVTAANTLLPIQPSGDFVATAGVPVAVQASMLSPTGTPVTGAIMQVAFTTGDASVALTDAGGGNYIGVWTPVQTGPVSLLFTGTNAAAGVVTGTVSASAAKLPAFTAAGAVSSATFLSGAPLAVGSIASLFGENLAAQATTATNYPLQTTLGGTSLTINGVAAPLFYVSPGQINFFVPWELAGQTTATIEVSTAAGVAEAASVAISPESPGIYLEDSAADAAAVHLTGQIVSATAPATGGETLEIFATGLGPVSNAPADSAQAPSNPAVSNTITPVVTIGGVSAQVSFAGLAPGFTGLNQLNVIVPQGLPSGPAILTIATGPVVGNTVVLQVH